MTLVITYLLVAVIGAVIATYMALVVHSFFFKYTSSESNMLDVPMISIVVAARNEEKNIERCIDSLLKLDYPKDKIEILIGNDASQDKTGEILDRLEKEHPELQIFNIEQPHLAQKPVLLTGKQFVLSELCSKTKGTYLAFTDADIQVPSTWLKSMVVEMEQDANVAIVSGITSIRRAPFQSLEWIEALAKIKTLSDYNIPVTALGNNMMVRKSAYDSIGGYQSLEPSAVEDFALFQQLTKEAGYGFKILYDEKIKALSERPGGFLLYLMQRKRWIKGAVRLPWQIKWVLILQMLYYPTCGVLFYLKPELAWPLFWSKYSIQTLYLALLSFKIRIRISIFALLFYEFFACITMFLHAVFFVLPIPLKWKGRVI